MALRCSSSHSRSYWWPRRKQQVSMLGNEMLYQRVSMRDGHWVRQRGDAANLLAGIESNLQTRRYNGQAGQETNRDAGSASYYELPLQTGSTTKIDFWMASKGTRWTNAWENLRSQVDNPAHGQGVRELYKSTDASDAIISSDTIVQNKQSPSDEAYDYTLPSASLSSSAIRRNMGHKGSRLGKPAADRTTRRGQTIDNLDHSQEALLPKAEISPNPASHQSSEMVLEHTPEMPIGPLESIGQDANQDANEDVSDEEFLEQVQFAPTNIADELALDTGAPTKPEIHILGTGPLGLHLAHSLRRSLDPPPVTILMHRPLKIQQWHEEGAAIRVVKNGRIYSSSGFTIESSAQFGIRPNHSKRRYGGFGENLEHTIEQPNNIISNLIVTTRAQQTIAALRTITHRLDHNSTICFVNGGMGIIEEVNEHIFPDKHSRPFYMQARSGHDVRHIDNHNFSIEDREGGDISFTICNRTVATHTIAPSIVKTHRYWSSSSRYILRRFTAIPDLCASGYSKKQFLLDHLQRVATNCIIGPYSVIYNCFANELLYNRAISNSIKGLLEEISTVLIALPEMQKVESRHKAFGLEKLEAMLYGQLEKMGRNRTQMWRDVNDGRRTAIDYYNGYIIKRAEELGIDCPNLKFFTLMVTGKGMMKQQEMHSYIKWDKDGSWARHDEGTGINKSED